MAKKKRPRYPRSGRPLYIYLPVEVDDALRAVLAQTDPVITKTAYVESLIRADLRRRGLLPTELKRLPHSAH